MTGPRVISADSHVQEPPDLYQRLSMAMRERGPRQVERDGKTYVRVDGRKPRRIDLAEARVTEDDQNREFRNDPSGGRDLDLRLGDLERDGIAAEVIYPNQSLGLYMSPEPAYQMAVATAYNDWRLLDSSKEQVGGLLQLVERVHLGVLGSHGVRGLRVRFSSRVDYVCYND